MIGGHHMSSTLIIKYTYRRGRPAEQQPGGRWGWLRLLSCLSTKSRKNWAMWEWTWKCIKSRMEMGTRKTRYLAGEELSNYAECVCGEHIPEGSAVACSCVPDTAKQISIRASTAEREHAP